MQVSTPVKYLRYFHLRVNIRMCFGYRSFSSSLVPELCFPTWESVWSWVGIEGKPPVQPWACSWAGGRSQEVGDKASVAVGGDTLGDDNGPKEKRELGLRALASGEGPGVHSEGYLPISQQVTSSSLPQLPDHKPIMLFSYCRWETQVQGNKGTCHGLLSEFLTGRTWMWTGFLQGNSK